MRAAQSRAQSRAAHKSGGGALTVIWGSVNTFEQQIEQVLILREQPFGEVSIQVFEQRINGNSAALCWRVRG